MNVAVPAGARPVKQARSLRTQEKLIAAGFKLLEKKDFDAIGVGEIAKAAHCSVGAMYDRFENKEAFFLALTDRLATARREQLPAPYQAGDSGAVIKAVVMEIVDWVRAHRNLWRAALRKGMDDPEYWQPFRDLGQETQTRFLDYVSEQRGAPLSPEEARQIRFALQMVVGTINNSLVNRPGPLALEEDDFGECLIDAFVNVGRLHDISGKI